MRILGQTLVVGTAAALAFIVAPACVDNDQSIFIRDALYPATTRTNNACIYSNDATQAALFLGVLDVAVRDNYSATLLVGNQMIARADSTEPRSESNKAHINGAVVRVTDANGNFISTFTSPSQGFVDQAEGDQATYGPIEVVALDAPTTFKLRAGMQVNDAKLVLANIKVFGESLGGVDLESGEYQLPIRVCNGCLLSFAGYDDATVQGIDCNLAATASTTTTASTVLPCSPGQDEATFCNECLGHQVPDQAKQDKGVVPATSDPCAVGPFNITSN